MVLRESIAANPHEGKLLFRLGQYTKAKSETSASRPAQEKLHGRGEGGRNSSLE